MSLTFDQFKKLPEQEQMKIRQQLNKKYLIDAQRATCSPKPEFLSPALAEKLLAIPVSYQRPVLDAVVKRYADSIISGSWQLNGHTASLAPNEGLLNGKQRASAVVLCQVGIPIVFVRNVDPSTFWSMDGGPGRTGPQVLNMIDVKHAKIAAPAVNFLLKYFKNRKLLHNRGVYISKDEMINAIKNDYPGLMNSIEYCNRKEMRKIVSPAIASFCHFIFSQIDPKDCDNFFRYLMTGANLAESNPIRFLRDKLITIQASREVTTAHDKAVFIVKGWNCWRTNKRLTKTAFQKDMDVIPDPV